MLQEATLLDGAPAPATGGVARDASQPTWGRHDQRVGSEPASRRHLSAGLLLDVSDVVLLLGEDGRICYQSPSAAGAWGYAPEVVAAKGIFELVEEPDRQRVRALFARALATAGETVTTNVGLLHADGTPRDFNLRLTNRLDHPDLRGVVATLRDISERRAFEHELASLAYRDPLSRLPARGPFMERVEQALARAARQHHSIALLLVDIDNFKHVNDSLGHGAGDTLLVALARRLERLVRTEDSVSRFSGDEFTLLIEDVTDPADACAVAARICQEVQAPVHVKGHEIYVTASVGVALGSGQDRAERLLRDAHLALGRAKAGGKSRYDIFDADLSARALERLELETDLHRALAGCEMHVYYQPVVTLGTERIVGMEALVRWQHPRRGLMMPSDFVPLAEESDLILRIDRWVLATACAQMRRWSQGAPHDPPLSLSVNLSARHFRNPDLVLEIERILRDADFDPHRLILEITEQTAMHDVDASTARLNELRRIGIQIAIDDFGTGYSSLSYLKRFPIDILKIDRAFTQGLGKNEEDTAIVRATIAFAKALRLSVTTEGVETSAQVSEVRSLGGDRAQGFYFGKPLRADQIGNVLALRAAPRRESRAARARREAVG